MHVSGAGPEANMWLFIAPSLVPQAWRPRAVQVAFVPLLAEEAAHILQVGTEHLVVAPDDLALANLTARGLSPEGIARDLGVPVRSVYRHLSRLREAVGAATTGELAARLAHSGFGRGTKLPDETTGRPP